MYLFIALLAAFLALQDADAARIEKLIQDLGAPEYEVREKAQKELVEIGSAALPALRKALEDSDAERAHRARKAIDEIERRARKPGEGDRSVRSELRVTGRDLVKGMTFQLNPDGSVEVTVREEDKETGRKVHKTYRAESLEEFKRQYPEIAKEYRIDRFVPRQDREFKGPWAWKEWRWPFEPDESWDRDEWDRWLERQREFFERFRRFGPPGFRKEPGEAASGRAFGVSVGRVDEALAEHLNLKEGEGLVVLDVQPGSAAEKAGVRRHDVVIALDGKPVGSPEDFRAAVRQRLEKGFELEVIRKGRRETLKVAPATEKY
ncbi:MAG TPA: PDZ domain-containing protein [Planctomycetota bacterium]|nr:PDZ domain-containing protein [Planctomycetota bacterium]